MQFYRIINIVLLTITYTGISHACICMKLGSDFFDTVSQHNTKVNNGEYPASDTLTILTGRVEKYQSSPNGTIPIAMLLKVGQIIQGSVAEKAIWVEGDTDGMQCRPPVIDYNINSNYIFAIQQDVKKHYYISGCGYYSKATASPSASD